MVKKDYLSRFQSFLQDQIPDSICLILRKTGYDTAVALEALNSEELQNLEKYIEQRKDILEELRDTEYSTVHPFKFLPGHSVLLLGLKKKTQEFHSSLVNNNCDLRSKSSSNRGNRSRLPVTTTQSDLGAESYFGGDSVEDVEHASSLDSGNEENTIKSALISKLSEKLYKYIKRSDIDIDLRDKEAADLNLNVGEIEKSKNSHGKVIYKCSLKCVICEVRTPCSYIQHWQISNYEAHLKKFHKKHEINEPSESNRENSIENHNNISEKSTVEFGDKAQSTMNGSENSNASASASSSVNNNRFSLTAAAQDKLNAILQIGGLNLQ